MSVAFINMFTGTTITIDIVIYKLTSYTSNPCLLTIHLESPLNEWYLGKVPEVTAVA